MEHMTGYVAGEVLGRGLNEAMGYYQYVSNYTPSLTCQFRVEARGRVHEGWHIGANGVFFLHNVRRDPYVRQSHYMQLKCLPKDVMYVLCCDFKLA